MRSRKMAWVAAAAAAGVAVAATGVGLAWAQAGGKGDKAAEQPECEIERLAGDYGDPESVSPSGEFIVGSTHDEAHAEDDKTATLWADGELEDLMPAVQEAIPETTSATATAVNDAGTVVGYTMDFDSDGQGFRYQDGETVALTAPEGYPDVRVGNMNADGAVIGTASEGEMGESVPVMWEADATEATVLEAPDGELTVTDIADDGTIFGNVYEEADETYRVVSMAPGGEWEELGIKDAGGGDPVVSGDWLLAGDYRLNLAEGGEAENHELAAKNPDDMYPSATTIDAEGNVYGQVKEGVAAIGTGGEIVELPQKDDDYVVPPLPSLASADGSVVAGYASDGFDEHEVHDPYVWTCA
ncbi:MAG: hypothetical protein ACRD0P_10065 [Stackebrandtia sp.]